MQEYAEMYTKLSTGKPKGKWPPGKARHWWKDIKICLNKRMWQCEL